MPLFRIKVVPRIGKDHCVFRDVPDVDLDTYYLEMHRKAVAHYGENLAVFECEQISVYSSTYEVVMRNKAADQVKISFDPFYRKKGER